MIILLSPAKSLDFSRQTEASLTTPRLLHESNQLARVARDFTRSDIKQVMKVSDDLADLNFRRFQAFSEEPSEDVLGEAAAVFDGDAYKTLDYVNLSPRVREQADQRLRLLSGLYGVLRPRDGIQPYRMEMGRPILTERGRSLYAFWGDIVRDIIEEDAANINASTVLNLASEEYSRVYLGASPRLDVVSPRFLEERNGTRKVISFSAKRARGAMARWVLKEGIQGPDDLTSFNRDGYRHDPTELQPLSFVRQG